MNMPVPVEVTFRGMDPSDAIEADIRRHAEALGKFAPKITHCRVAVEAPHQHHRKGRLYHVRVEVNVPGEDVVISRDPGDDRGHTDCYVAIHDAFKATQRRVQDYVRRRRHEVKAHAAPPAARVLRLFHDEGFGFLGTDDGREIYFHRNSVAGDGFAALKPGMEVEFTEEAGEKGPQATSVRPM
jgi:cold shock CspA family protein